MNIFLNQEQKEVKRFVEYCRKNSHFIREIRQDDYPNISSFNFTRETFFNSVWDDITVKARGLYIDTKNWKVVGRGFDKFFNINEQPYTEFSIMCRNGLLRGKINAYTKANGYLGLVFVYNNKLCFAQKSRMDSANRTLDSIDKKNVNFYADNFKLMFNSIFTIQELESIKKWCKENNVTLLFEIVDMRNDPHIIKNTFEKHLYFLTAVKNSLKFNEIQVTYDMPINNVLTSHPASLHKIDAVYTFKEYEEFTLNKISILDPKKFTFQNINIFNNNLEPVEGYVFCDEYGNRVKFKCSYYLFWKAVRGILDSYKNLINGYVKKQDEVGLKKLATDCMLHLTQLSTDNTPIGNLFQRTVLKQPILMYENMQNYLYNLNVYLHYVTSEFTTLDKCIKYMIENKKTFNNIINFRENTKHYLINKNNKISFGSFSLKSIDDNNEFDNAINSGELPYGINSVSPRNRKDIINYYLTECC